METEKTYPAGYDELVDYGREEPDEDKRPALKSYVGNMDERDSIFLGFPNYWGNMPMAVYTFLEKFDWNGKTVHLFCTHEGSGLSGTERKIQGVCKGGVVTKGLAVQGGSAGRAGAAVEKWV